MSKKLFESPLRKPDTLLYFLSSMAVAIGIYQYKQLSYQQQPAPNNVQETIQPSEARPSVQYVFDDSEMALTQSLQDVRYQELTASIETFLAGLSEQQRAAMTLPYDHPFRTRDFCYVLARCKEDYVGLRIRDLTAEQKVALNNVLMKSFSGAGYSRAIQTMNNEWLLEEMEAAHRADPEAYPTVGSPLVENWPPPAQRSAPDFYLAFFGDPSSMDAWGMRFEGHHLSLNLSFGGEGEQVNVATLPMFFGSSPMIVPESPDVAEGEVDPYPRWESQEGQQILHRESWLSRSFLTSLDAEMLAMGEWSELPDVVLAGGADVPLDAASYLEGESEGIAVADLTPLQQNLLWEFSLEFLQLQANHHVDLDAFKADLADARVWWFGDAEDEQADLYFRVQSDRYLVELLQSNTFAVLSEIDSNHVHASFRDLTNDWDYNVLGEHVHEYHHALAAN